MAQLLAKDVQEGEEANAAIQDGMGHHETLLDHEVLHVDLGQDLPQKMDSDDKNDTGQDEKDQATPEGYFKFLAATESWDLDQRQPCAHSGVECDIDCPYFAFSLLELAL